MGNQIKGENMQTENLIVRRFNHDDITDFTELIRDKMSSVYSKYDYQYPVDDISLREILNYFTKSDEFFAVVLKTSAKVIGFLTLNNCGEPRVRNLGYCIHSQYQGKGYGTEAVIELIRYVKEELKLKKLITCTAQENIPSVRLLTSVGFMKTGESSASFVKDEKGNPVEFLGFSYELLLD